MVKFVLTKVKKDNSKSFDSKEIDENNSVSNDENSFSINIKINKKENKKNIKIGKYIYDDNTMTRVAIVKLKNLGYKIKDITKILKISRMLAWKWYYYEKYEGKGTRKSKFSSDEKKFLCNKVEGKITGKDGASSRSLTKEFYDVFKKSISHTSVNNILNQGISKPLKVINTFNLTKLHEEKRQKFSEFIINNKISSDNIFFTDECRVVLFPKLNKQNNFIRLNKEDKKDRWKPEIQKMIANETPKFEQSIMIAGGISKYGLSSIIFCSGTQNNFSYKQFLLFMKKDIEKIKKDNNLKEPFYFQQDNAACHVSQESKLALDILFGKEIIDWPPNSPDLSPIENVWAILKDKLSKRNIKNLDELRENIIDIWSKFPVSLCEKLCSQFNDKIKYVQEMKGKRINKDMVNQIKKENKKNNSLFIPINNDNEWISIKRDNNYRIVYNDKIVKKIKARLIKQIKKKKNMKIKLFNKKNIKLKKGEKTHIKLLSRDEYNKNIDEKKSILEEYYDNKIEKIEKLSCTDFIIKFLDKENKYNLKKLMCTNLSSNFEIDDNSTNFTCQENEEDIDKEIKSQIDKIFERNRFLRVKEYIDDEVVINNFPYEQKKLRNGDNEVNEIKYEDREIFSILKEMTDLNEKIKEYEKENIEKCSQIEIEMKEKENKDFDDDIENEDENNEIEENEMEID